MIKTSFNGELLVRHSRAELHLADLADFRPSAEAKKYALTPLFRQEQADDVERSLPLAWTGSFENGWAVAAPQSESVLQGNPWDQAHRYVDEQGGVAERFSVGGGGYAEPNFNHELPKPAQSINTDVDYDPDWPIPARMAFHLEDGFTQLTAAGALCNGGKGVRIVILDTGFDPLHLAQPRNLRADLGRDFFISKLGKQGAVDPCEGGFLLFPGHGHATLSLLAGGAVDVNYSGTLANPPKFSGDMGGAPEAEIIPVRITNSVINLYTNAMASGINYAATLPDGAADVVSISQGGLPSRAWAKAVNEAYDRGVVLVAASGNCYSGLPTRGVVYPARFRRVLTACGVTAGGGAYRHDKFIMQGNFGPASVMDDALAAYTPNIMWAKGQQPDMPAPHAKFQLNGAGTSCSTPQIAAAAALWIAKHRDKVSGVGQAPWRKVEAVRAALLESAKFDERKAEYFGRGILRARDAVDEARALEISSRELSATPEDDVSFPFFRVLFGFPEPSEQSARQRMFETEAAQLAMRGDSEVLAQALSTGSGDFAARVNSGELTAAIRESPHASTRLKDFVANN